MAFTYTEVGTGKATTGTTVATSSFTTKRGALYLCIFSEFGRGNDGFGASCTSVTSSGFVAPATAVDNIDWSGIYPNQALTVDSSTKLWTLQLFLARGNGSASAVTFTVDQGPDLDLGGDYAHLCRVYEIAGTTGVPIGVRQHKTAYAASTSTAAVTLTNAVLPDSECIYLALWETPSDTATPGSGWTERSDASWESMAQFYVQTEPTPTGAQQGSVSAIATQEAVSAIFEVRELKTGWGVSI